MMKNTNIDYIFSGHTHPHNFHIKHHEYGGLEFIGTSTKRTKSFGVVTIDNERLVYNLFKYNKKNAEKCFMTHPIPVKQISRAH